MRGRIWTASNGLSLLRMVLVVPVGILLFSDAPGARITAALLIGLAALTDFLDGLLARKLNEVTRLGKILDPVADKVGIGVVAVVLALRGTLPWWFSAMVVGRDVAIMAAAGLLARRNDAVPQSNRIGKWTAAVLALTLFAAVLDPHDSAGILRPSIAAAVVMAVLSALSYARRLAARPGETAGPST